MREDVEIECEHSWNVETECGHASPSISLAHLAVVLQHYVSTVLVGGPGLEGVSVVHVDEAHSVPSLCQVADKHRNILTSLATR